ncbi:MAG: hypothetical protein V4456_23550, partial [Bacteroidota bacterium]
NVLLHLVYFYVNSVQDKTPLSFARKRLFNSEQNGTNLKFTIHYKSIIWLKNTSYSIQPFVSPINTKKGE